MRVSQLLLGLGLFTISACGGDDASGPSTPANVAGNWTMGVAAPAGNGASLELSITQTGTNLTGTGRVVDGPTLTLTGTVDGKKVEITFVTAAPCQGQIDVDATVSTSGTQMTGSLHGTYCIGPVSATFVANKVN